MPTNTVSPKSHLSDYYIPLANLENAIISAESTLRQPHSPGMATHFQTEYLGILSSVCRWAIEIGDAYLLQAARLVTDCLPCVKNVLDFECREHFLSVLGTVQNLLGNLCELRASGRSFGKLLHDMINGTMGEAALEDLRKRNAE